MITFTDSSKSMILRLVCLGWRQVFGGRSLIALRKRGWQAIVFWDGEVAFTR